MRPRPRSAVRATALVFITGTGPRGQGPNPGRALKSTGLSAGGYHYASQDDFWDNCQAGQGPDADSDGRWVINATAFPSSGSTNGIHVVANYVPGLGLKLGLYVTPGIFDQAVSKTTVTCLPGSPTPGRSPKRSSPTGGSK